MSEPLRFDGSDQSDPSIERKSRPAPVRKELAPNALRFSFTCMRQFGRVSAWTDASDEEIQQAIEKLPDRYRLFLELRFGLFDGLTRTYLEIARDAAVIEGTRPVSDQRARDIVLRALSKVQRSLKKHRNDAAA